MSTGHQDFSAPREADPPAASDRPKRAYLNVAKRCNARCVYCGDWMNGTDPAVEYPTEAILAVVDDLRRLGVGHVTVSGGEPLIRKDLWRIADRITAAGMSWSIITNGTMLGRANAQRLLEHGVSHVNISIDTLSPHGLRALRGLSVDRITVNALGLRTLIASAGAHVEISVIAVISRSTVSQLPDLARFCHDHDFGLTLQPLHREESGRDGADLAVHWPDGPVLVELERVLDELISRKTEDGWRIDNPVGYLQAIHEFFRRGTFHPDRPCTTGAVDLVVDTDLQVRPCWAMPPIARITPRMPLTAVVAAPAYRAVRAQIAAGHCPGCLFACHLNRQLT